MTNIKLIHVLLLSLLINIYHVFFMVISGNMLSQLSINEPLNGGNYGSWRETIEIALALWEIDLALKTDPPKEPAQPVIREGEDAEAFATRQRDFMPTWMQYDLDIVRIVMLLTVSVSWALRAPSWRLSGEQSHRVR
jgi:hypothetical protein